MSFNDDRVFGILCLLLFCLLQKVNSLVLDEDLLIGRLPLVGYFESHIPESLVGGLHALPLGQIGCFQSTYGKFLFFL